jgi:hypothetical protein
MKSMSKKKVIKNPEMSDNQKNWNVVTGCDFQVLGKVAG